MAIANRAESRTTETLTGNGFRAWVMGCPSDGYSAHVTRIGSTSGSRVPVSFFATRTEAIAWPRMRWPINRLARFGAHDGNPYATAHKIQRAAREIGLIALQYDPPAWRIVRGDNISATVETPRDSKNAAAFLRGYKSALVWWQEVGGAK